VFDLLGRDGARVADLFGPQLARQGRFDLSADPAFAQAGTRYGFVSGKSTHSNRLDTIRDTFARFGLTIDTHTADGVKVARERRQPGETVVVLETALPIKFAETIREALGRDPARPAKFDGIEALPKRVQVMPVSTAQVQDYIRTHCPL
jgi:threonine synthase